MLSNTDFISYHMYLISNGHRFLGAVNFAYMCSFRNAGDPALPMSSVFEVRTVSEVNWMLQDLHIRSVEVVVRQTLESPRSRSKQMRGYNENDLKNEYSDWEEETGYQANSAKKKDNR